MCISTYLIVLTNILHVLSGIYNVDADESICRYPILSTIDNDIILTLAPKSISAITTFILSMEINNMNLSICINTYLIALTGVLHVLSAICNVDAYGSICKYPILLPLIMILYSHSHLNQ